MYEILKCTDGKNMDFAFVLFLECNTNGFVYFRPFCLMSPNLGAQARPNVI